ncbi:hypothetical protein HJFPF1_07593 [Paramyrothecium foliicola]|nr:hypothetical protein HJFPF1_07593 [Paramyrothecium foliicola]
MTGWPNLPTEVRWMIFDYIVCREWQYEFEKKTFEQITVGQDRLQDFETFVYNNPGRRKLLTKIVMRFVLVEDDQDYAELLDEDMMENLTHLTLSEDVTKRSQHQRTPAFKDENSTDLAIYLSEQCQNLTEFHATLVVDAHYFFGWLPFCYPNLTTLTLSSECDEYIYQDEDEDQHEFGDQPPEHVVDCLLIRAGIAAFYCMPKLQRLNMWGMGKKDNEPYGWCFILEKHGRNIKIEFYSSFDDWDLDLAWSALQLMVIKETGQDLEIDKKRIPSPRTYEDVACYCSPARHTQPIQQHELL